MNDGAKNSVWLAGFEVWAFGALIATVFSIVFSIVLGQMAAGMCYLFFMVALIRRQVQGRMGMLAWTGLAFIAVAVASSLLAGGARELFHDAGKLLWFLLLPVTVSLVKTPRRAMQIVWAFLGGGLVLSLKDLVMHPVRAMRDPVPNFLTALIDKGSMTDGQMLMLAVVSGTAVALVFIRNQRRVPLWLWVMLSAQIAGLLINFKRGSWLCAVLLVGGLLVSHLKWRGLLVAVIVVAGLVALPPIQSRLSGLGSEFTRGDGRLAMWTKVAPSIVQEYPMGVGYGRLTNEMMKQAWPRIEPNRDHLHANWAQVLVETGWPGVSVFLLWMVGGIILAVRTLLVARKGGALERVVAPVIVLMLAGLILNGFVEYNFGDTELMFIYAVVLGLTTGFWRGGATHAERTEFSQVET